MIAGLLLAAGRSRRFGGDKLLAPLCGRPLMCWGAATLASAVDALFVVLPPDDAARSAALAPLACTIVEHARRDDGMGSSIAAGVAALPDAVDAVVILLADQPLVSRETIVRVRERWSAGDTQAVATRYRDGQGHPVLFGRSVFPRLRGLSGDRGARAVLVELGDRLADVEVDATMPADVDSPDALRELAAIWLEQRGGPIAS